MSGPGTLKKLRSYGFQTFDPFIDEKYDLIDNVYDRLEELKKEIDRIAQFSYDELLDLKKEMAPILEHNKKRYLLLTNKSNFIKK
jgi:hypothetical protein